MARMAESELPPLLGWPAEDFMSARHLALMVSRVLPGWYPSAACHMTCIHRIPLIPEFYFRAPFQCLVCWLKPWWWE